MILFVLTIFFCTVLPAQAANLPPITGVQFFPADHIWNVPVNTLPVSPMSNTYINSANSSAYLYVQKGFFYNIVNSSTPKQYMTSIRYSTVSDNVPVPPVFNSFLPTTSGMFRLIHYRYPRCQTHISILLIHLHISTCIKDTITILSIVPHRNNI